MIDESLMLDVNGIHIHTTTTGQGPAVLLLHGFPDTHIVWRKQVPALAAAGFRVLAPDLRGYGRSDAPGGVFDYTMDKLRGDVLGLLDALHIDKVFLAGHDWGGIIGWQIAALAPERVHRYVAMSTGHPYAIAHAGMMQRLRMTYILGSSCRCWPNIRCARPTGSSCASLRTSPAKPTTGNGICRRRAA
ncbi:alpha/beta fold hydrolase [Massilia phosphatilytica]